MNLRGENLKMVGKLAVVTAGMFCFGYALIPIYKHICEITGINILSVSERKVQPMTLTKILENRYDANMIGWSMPLDLYWLNNRVNEPCDEA